VEARITQQLEGLTPGSPVFVLSLAELKEGVIAFAAIRAPSGLAQQVIFEWRHKGERERIAATIEGGRATGFRTYSRKRVFPEDPTGLWTVDVITPHRQLLRRMRFFVVDGASSTVATAHGRAL